MLSRDSYRAMLKRIARYLENDNENYRAIVCNLSSDVNEVSRDNILHRLLYFVLYLFLFITNFETNGLL